MQRKTMVLGLVAFGSLMVALAVPLLHTTQAQEDVPITIYIDPDFLVVYVPGTQHVSLQNLGFEVMIGDERKTYRLDQYSGFRTLHFDDIPVPICFRLARDGSNKALPEPCDPSHTLTHYLSSADVFWYDYTSEHAQTLNLVRGIEVLDFCPADVVKCDRTYRPPTLTPSPPDSDGDGIRDEQDACPNQGDEGCGVQSDGCPVPDSDYDGICDPDDKCPYVANDTVGDPCNPDDCPNRSDRDGVGDPCNHDEDGDRIDDDNDACPYEGDEGSGLMNNGCPLQGRRWDGADDLPVSPLSCGSRASQQPDTTRYNGGQPTNPVNLARKDITLVDVPKLVGVGYFSAITKGEQQAAEELGNVKVTTDAPTEADVDEQIRFIENYISYGIDGILFAANDSGAIADVLHSALSQGIHVVGYDSDTRANAREWFINKAADNAIAKALVDSLAAEKGEDAHFGIVTSTFADPNQSRWIAEMWAYTSQCYPDMVWLETLEAQQDGMLSFEQASTLLDKYGEGLDGLFGMTSVATPSAADAVTQAGLCGRVAIVGLGTPNSMKPYVNDRCVRSVVLWNPEDLGYAAVYVMRAAVDGTLQPGDTSVSAGRLGMLQIVNGSEVLLGEPFIYTANNINDFDF